MAAECRGSDDQQYAWWCVKNMETEVKKQEAEAKKERARKLMSQRALLGKRLKKAVEKGAITESQLKEIESGKGSNVSMKG